MHFSSASRSSSTLGREPAPVRERAARMRSCPSYEAALSDCAIKYGAVHKEIIGVRLGGRKGIRLVQQVLDTDENLTAGVSKFSEQSVTCRPA